MRVVICGGGAAGLSAALMLHRRGHHVTVLERDAARTPANVASAWERWERRGVPQFRHFHAYSGLARRTLLRELPEVYEALLDAGVAELDVHARLRALFPDTLPTEEDADLVSLRGRRTTFEWTLRNLLDRSGVELRPGVSADGLLWNGTKVVGVVCGGVEVLADVVVDATGRRAASERWLADAGLPPGRTLRSETGIVYYSRWYRLRPGVEPLGNVIRLDLLSMRAVLSPSDDGFASLAFSPAAEDVALKALRRAPAFQRVAQNLPLIGEWVHPDRASSVTDVLFMGNLENRHRTPAAERNESIAGMVAIGDASTITNPYFGKGIALGVAHAASLARMLDEELNSAEVAARFGRVTQETMRPWYEEIAKDDDLHQLWLRVGRGKALTSREEQRLASDEAKEHRALPIAMARDATIFRLWVRNLMSLDPPERMHAPEVTRRALALVREDELVAAPLSRNELLALLESA